MKEGACFSFNWKMTLIFMKYGDSIYNKAHKLGNNVMLRYAPILCKKISKNYSKMLKKLSKSKPFITLSKFNNMNTCVQILHHIPVYIIQDWLTIEVTSSQDINNKFGWLYNNVSGF
jgi:hypothetical protein